MFLFSSSLNLKGMKFRMILSLSLFFTAFMFVFIPQLLLKSLGLRCSANGLVFGLFFFS